MYPKPIQRLVESLRILPSVGQKTALRMALYLLERDRSGAERLSKDIIQALEKVCHCEQCRHLSDTPICPICSDQTRDYSQVCVVENPADVYALSQATDYRGRYFVLMGHLSPLDGIGPEHLGLPLLAQQLQQGHIKELILATNSTLEGEATAYYIGEMAKQHHVFVSRIAHGVPMGGELEYLDGGTLSHALSARQRVG